MGLPLTFQSLAGGSLSPSRGHTICTICQTKQSIKVYLSPFILFRIEKTNNTTLSKQFQIPIEKIVEREK
jgi:hypothetical protein